MCIFIKLEEKTVLDVSTLKRGNFIKDLFKSKNRNTSNNH